MSDYWINDYYNNINKNDNILVKRIKKNLRNISEDIPYDDTMQKNYVDTIKKILHKHGKNQNPCKQRSFSQSWKDFQRSSQS